MGNDPNQEKTGNDSVSNPDETDELRSAPSSKTQENLAQNSMQNSSQKNSDIDIDYQFATPPVQDLGSGSKDSVAFEKDKLTLKATDPNENSASYSENNGEVDVSLKLSTPKIGGNKFSVAGGTRGSDVFLKGSVSADTPWGDASFGYEENYNPIDGSSGTKMSAELKHDMVPVPGVDGGLGRNFSHSTNRKTDDNYIYITETTELGIHLHGSVANAIEAKSKLLSI